MFYEWDEAKRLRNIDRHRLDFEDVDLLFGGPHITGPAKTVGQEARMMAVGMIGDVHVTVIYTLRDSNTRVISLRRASYGERKRYQEIYEGGA